MLVGARQIVRERERRLWCELKATKSVQRQLLENLQVISVDLQNTKTSLQCMIEQLEGELKHAIDQREAKLKRTLDQLESELQLTADRLNQTKQSVNDLKLR
jgi:hypothetical protein